jgi:hypothetical protein
LTFRNVAPPGDSRIARLPASAPDRNPEALRPGAAPRALRTAAPAPVDEPHRLAQRSCRRPIRRRAAPRSGFGPARLRVA